MEDEQRQSLKYRLEQWISRKANIAGWKKLKLTENLMAFLINLGHPLFVTRFQYNPTENIPLQLIKSPLYKCIHYIMLIIMLLGSATQLIGMFVDISLGNFDLRSGTDTIRFLISLTNGMAAVFLFNLSWLAKEISQQWNMAIQLTEDFLKSHETEQIVKRREKMNIICQALMMTFIFILGLIWATMNALSLGRCRYHIYSPFLPICEERVGKHIGGLMSIIGYTALQYFTSFYYCLTILITACFIIHAVQAVHYAFDVLEYNTMQIASSGSHFNLATELDWNKTYRSMNIAVTANYNAFGRLVYPVFFADVVIALVIGNVILLTSGSDLIAKGSVGIVSFGLIMFIMLVILDATKFPTQSSAILFARKQLQTVQNRELKQWSRCAREMRIYVSNFCYLREEFIPEMLDLVIDCTIDAILA